MNKKGFTLIEIIICLVIISTISVSVVLLVNNNGRKDLIENTNEILNAANIYIEVEKDENGNNYRKEILKGAKGVKIPLKSLVNRGYIEENVANNIYKNNADLLTDEEQDLYVLFVNGSTKEGSDYCKIGQITSLASWMIEDEPIYLCNDYGDEDLSDKTFEYINNFFNLINTGVLKYDVDTTKFAVSTEYIQKLKSEGKDVSNLTDKENGMFVFNEDGELYVYYRGAVDNNYVELGKDASGNPLIWRIIWIRQDNKIKLVLDDIVELKTTHSNEPITTTSKVVGIHLQTFLNGYDSNDMVLNNIFIKYGDKCKYKWESWKYCNVNEYFYINSDDDIIDETGSCAMGVLESTYKIDEKDILSNNYDILSDDYIQINDNFYYTKLLEWYNNTDLNTHNLVTTENNFCVDKGYSYMSWDGNYIFYAISDNFNCNYIDGVNNSTTYDTSLSAPIYFLNHGDVVLAGISKNATTSDLTSSGNYLFSRDGIILLSKQHQSRANSSNNHLKKTWYTLTSSGISAKTYFESFGYKGCSYKKTFVDSSTNTIIESYYPYKENLLTYSETSFITNILKPTIIIDINDLFINGDGTKINPYKIVKN